VWDNVTHCGSRVHRNVWKNKMKKRLELIRMKVWETLQNRLKIRVSLVQFLVPAPADASA